MPPAAAIAGAAVVGAGASMIGASKNAKAINKSTDASVQAQQYSADQQLQAARENIALQTAAYNQSADAQAQAYNANNAVQTGIYNNNVGMLNPYTQTGYSAMNRINAMLGLDQQEAYTPQPVRAGRISVDPIQLPESVANSLAPPQQATTSAARPPVSVPTGFGGVTQLYGQVLNKNG